jgi:hypothetical protein
MGKSLKSQINSTALEMTHANAPLIHFQFLGSETFITYGKYYGPCGPEGFLFCTKQQIVIANE